MRFGLEEHIVDSLISVFEEHSKVDKAIVFGSRAKGNYRPDSDIDIAIKGQELTTDDIILMAVAFEAEGITYKIDLIDYNKIKEPDLKAHIDRVGIEFYSSRKDITLKDLRCSLLSGYAFKSSDYSNFGIPLIKIGNIQNRTVTIDAQGDFVSHEQVNAKTSKYLLSNNDVLIAMTGQGSVGRVGKLKIEEGQKAFLNQRVGKFICDEKNLNIDYLFYILTSDKYQELLFNTGSGSGQPNLSPELILSTEIPWINYNEQVSIASILNSLDNKVDLLHRQNKTLEQLSETLFMQWFVEEADAYEMGRLGDVISIFDNLRIPISTMKREKMKVGKLYPYYGAAKIMDYINDYIFDGEYILMGEDGTVQTEDGFPILQMPTGKFWVNNHTHVLQAKEPYSNYLIYIFLKRTNINHIVTGAVQPKINQENLKSIEFPILPNDKVSDFVQITNDYWSKIKSNNNQIEILTQTRDALLPRLLNGEIRVTELNSVEN